MDSIISLDIPRGNHLETTQRTKGQPGTEPLVVHTVFSVQSHRVHGTVRRRAVYLRLIEPCLELLNPDMATMSNVVQRPGLVPSLPKYIGRQPSIECSMRI